MTVGDPLTARAGHALSDHLDDCESCASLTDETTRVAAILSQAEASLDLAAVLSRTQRSALPLLASNARRAFWRRVAAGLLASLIPLPLVVALDIAFLRAVSFLLGLVLPAVVVDYFVFTSAVFLVLLLALTYAAIPLLAERGVRRAVIAG